MHTITELMSRDHRACDHAFADAEALAAKGQWPAAEAALGRFTGAMLAHFTAEEDTLFPRFEAVTGMSGGPTAVMRAEHIDMRAALERMTAALAARDADDFAGEAETLLIMMQQHNMKEENILYPMCDARLGAEGAALGTALGATLAAAGNDAHAAGAA